VKTRRRIGMRDGKNARFQFFKTAVSLTFVESD